MKICAKETVVRLSVYQISAANILQHKTLYRKDHCQREDGLIHPDSTIVFLIAGAKDSLVLEPAVYPSFTWFLTDEKLQFSSSCVEFLLKYSML